MHPDFVNAREMLPTPSPRDLPDERVKGSRCVWCGGANTVNLGPRLGTEKGLVYQWSPRGCVGCSRRKARRAFLAHIRNCARCCRTRYCEDAHALHTLGWPHSHPDRRCS